MGFNRRLKSNYILLFDDSPYVFTYVHVRAQVCCNTALIVTALHYIAFHYNALYFTMHWNTLYFSALSWNAHYTTHFTIPYYTVYVLGGGKGYTVEYNPLPEGVPKGKARGNS